MESLINTNPPKNKRRLKTDEGNYKIQSPIIADESINPCLKEANLSNKCLYVNNYDKTMCGDAFANYALCRKFWKYVEWKRWYNGITPYLPPVEEREQVRKEIVQEFISFRRRKGGNKARIEKKNVDTEL